jgi:hypothetical protein
MGILSLKLRRPWSDGTKQLILAPTELLELTWLSQNR